MTTRLLLVLAISGALFTSCATTRSQRLEAIPERIVKGRTTRDQVVILLGEPAWKNVHPEGETWIYGNRPEKNAGNFAVNEAVGVGSSFIPVPFAGTAVRAILFVGKSAQKGGGKRRTQASIDFDRRGIVTDYSLVIPSGA